MNDCGTCTACCTSLDLQMISGVDYQFGSDCEHVCDTPGKGCSIYEDRPKPCDHFKCAYRKYDLPEKYILNKYGFLAEVEQYQDETWTTYCEIHPINHGQLNVQPLTWMADNRNAILEILEEIELETTVFIKTVVIKTVAGTCHFNRFILASTTD